MDWLEWGGAIAVALFGIALYLIWQTDWAWWVGGACVSVFAVVALWEAKKKGYRGGGEGDGGAFGPP